MLVLSLILTLFTSQNLIEDTVSIDFIFKKMRLGKPTLKYYYYDITLNNPTNQLKYVLIPRWFDKKLQETDKIWGAQFDSFGENNGSTLFSGTTFTVFALPPNHKITLTDFTIETFSEDIELKSITDIPIIICNNIQVAENSILDFMQKKELHTANLAYKLKDVVLINVLVKVK